MVLMRIECGSCSNYIQHFTGHLASLRNTPGVMNILQELLSDSKGVPVCFDESAQY